MFFQEHTFILLYMNLSELFDGVCKIAHCDYIPTVCCLSPHFFPVALLSVLSSSTTSS